MKLHKLYSIKFLKDMKFVIEGYCNGASPLEDEDIEMLAEENFYAELITLISNKHNDKAIELAINYFTAEFCLENVSVLENEGFEFIETSSVNLLDPFLEEVNGIQVPLFRWIGAKFILEGPRETIRNWMKKKSDGNYSFDEELFFDWVEENGGDQLQDGCCYNLGAVGYDLMGMGENGCSINIKSIEEAFNQT